MNQGTSGRTDDKSERKGLYNSCGIANEPYGWMRMADLISEPTAEADGSQM